MEDIGIFGTILSILQTNVILFDHLTHLVDIWYIFPDLVCMLYREKSGNPEWEVASFTFLSKNQKFGRQKKTFFQSGINLL
jgi:hypothetical protein